MSNFIKPQSPIYNESTDTYIYPLTTSDQVIMPDGTRLDADNIGRMNMELLWENASSNSDFAAQVVPIPIDYDFFLINFYGTGIATSNITHILKHGINSSLQSIQINGTEVYFSSRVVSVADEGISFTEGNYSTTKNTNKVTSNGVNKPLRIYGIK